MLSLTMKSLCYVILIFTIVPGDSGEKKVFTPPKVWVGESELQTTGNPVISDGRPLWRAEYLFPIDWKKYDNYHPLRWFRGRWGLERKADGEQGNTPALTVTSDTVRLRGFAGRWQSPPGSPFASKSSALVFIAPTSGAYSLSTVAELSIWEGEGPVQLFIIKKCAQDRSVKMLEQIDLSATESTAVENIQMRLNQGDELVLIPWIGKEKVGAEVQLKELCIQQTPPDVPARESGR